MCRAQRGLFPTSKKQRIRCGLVLPQIASLLDRLRRSRTLRAGGLCVCALRTGATWRRGRGSRRGDCLSASRNSVRARTGRCCAPGRRNILGVGRTRIRWEFAYLNSGVVSETFCPLIITFPVTGLIVISTFSHAFIVQVHAYQFVRPHFGRRRGTGVEACESECEHKSLAHFRFPEVVCVDHGL
jgi:hypothetical protein